jgi:hypothetical protein
MNTIKLYQASEGIILDMPTTGLRYRLMNEYVQATTDELVDLEELSFDISTQATVDNAIGNFALSTENGTIANTPGAVDRMETLQLIKEVVQLGVANFYGPEEE